MTGGYGMTGPSGPPGVPGPPRIPGEGPPKVTGYVQVSTWPEDSLLQHLPLKGHL